VIDVATPATIVDLDRLEANLTRWQAYCDEHGLANRPHVKTHKSVEIGARQVALGATGVTCQTLAEAEAMVGAGIDDVLLSHTLVGPRKLERLALLLARAPVRVTADDPELLPGLAGAAAAAGRELDVLVDCDTGLGRTGVSSPAEAAELAAAIARTDGLRFAGLITYPAPPAAREFFAAVGVDRGAVSAGGTPTMWRAAELRPVVTEYRAGTYAFNDRNTVAAGAASLEDCALTVAATVVSRRGSRAILDAGSKALSSDVAAAGGFGHLVDAPASTVERLDEEHAYVRIAPEDDLELGQQVRIVPNHACVAVNLSDELVGVRGDSVEARWAVERGR